MEGQCDEVSFTCDVLGVDYIDVFSLLNHTPLKAGREVE